MSITIQELQKQIEELEKERLEFHSCVVDIYNDYTKDEIDTFSRPFREAWALGESIALRDKT